MRSIVWNRHGVPYGIRRRRNGIKTEGGSGYTANRDAIRPTGNSIQFALRIDAIPSPTGPPKARQARFGEPLLRSWIRKTTVGSTAVFLGGACSALIARMRELFVFCVVAFGGYGSILFYDRKYYKGCENDNFRYTYDRCANRIKIVSRGCIVIIRKTAYVIKQ